MPSPPSRSTFALQFMLTSALVLAVAIGLGYVMIAVMPPALFPGVRFPPAFAASTFALLFGSSAMSQSIGFVRREKQSEFRRSLLIALCNGSLFVALQVSALNWLMHRQPATEVQTGERAFVAVIAALHAIHFVLAIMFLIYVLLKAHHDRYDHEYFWDVTVCAWFWHIQGIVWLAVLIVVAIGSTV